MSNVIDFWEKKRARLGGAGRRWPPSNRRARPTNHLRQADGFVRIGVISQSLMERLRRE